MTGKRWAIVAEDRRDSIMREAKAQQARDDAALADAVRDAKARQQAELQSLRDVLPVLVAVQGRYKGTRDGNKVSTQARKAGEAIETLLSLAEGR